MPPKNKSTEDESLEPQCKKHRPEVVENEENFPTTDEKHKSTDNGAEENSVSEENSDAEKGNKKVSLLFFLGTSKYLFKGNLNFGSRIKPLLFEPACVCEMTRSGVGFLNPLLFKVLSIFHLNLTSGRLVLCVDTPRPCNC